ncbi:nitronate monooxygenase [Nocardia stercoris]|uniref:Propionate 3-nitronate monooxygenase n=1 Tax=Nocardia stercoris TaxID=2483361 RepID=A0A3M2L2N8_9NOCA|nr:nitronate monooxygenase [Nocardia stercoris]
MLDDLQAPIVLAPMAGGPSTPALATAVSAAGGLGFLAAGYLPAATVAEQIAAVRGSTAAPFGVNLFVPGISTPPDRFAGYLTELGREFPLGEPRFDDDDWDAKLELLVAEPVAVVSFTFGCPDPAAVARLRAAGTECWVTVTGAAEARQAREAGADVLIAQGAEAGGHRATFADRPADDVCDPLSTLALVQLLTAAVPGTPIVAAGGLGTGAAVAGVLVAGAHGAQLGTAFLRCPEAGTSPMHRAALTTPTPTALTRAFSGRRARGLLNRFVAEHPDAPAAYPEIHYATGPLRQRARAEGDPDAVNLWAGQVHELTAAEPAGELVRRLTAEADDALRLAISRRIQGY